MTTSEAFHGEWDRDTPAAMSQALFPKLKSARWRRYVVIGEATRGTHEFYRERAQITKLAMKHGNDSAMNSIWMLRNGSQPNARRAA